MSNGEVEETQANELTVTFVPHLYEQRRAWVLDMLRREEVTAVLDVGCGEGETIACLCNPAPWLSPHASVSSMPPLAGTLSWEDIKSSILSDDFLHLEKVFAFDISSQALKDAVRMTIPQPQSEAGQWHGYTRWEPLHVKLWEGGLESYNPDFVNIDCIISTEVIEHLPEDILPEFAPMLLGVYHPRLLLITTPSYTFNARFTAPDAPSGARKGYADPTGRTARIFRHDDHKFEWTVEEFTTWCQGAAEEWGYDVEVAAFKRKEGETWTATRRSRTEAMDIWARIAVRPQQKLVADHLHEAHEAAGRTGTLQQIGQRLKSKIEEWDVPSATVHELWFEQALSVACGGCLNILLAAADVCEDVRLQRIGDKPLDWTIEWPGYVEKARPPEEQEQDNEKARESWSKMFSTGWGEMWDRTDEQTTQGDWSKRPAAGTGEHLKGGTFDSAWSVNQAWGSDEANTDTALGGWGQNTLAVGDWS
ncbi:hypothetical protein NM688_g221 [Phlebia brevispora]|uniref:Uncharacterized protein n=1 Tax=Phlebia brevispora TaxID=194682 RepID=A0ACC1TEU5_9APHY|nr:hypothetical protein NM688_g221 [Phlebia brevispora]